MTTYFWYVVLATRTLKQTSLANPNYLTGNTLPSSQDTLRRSPMKDFLIRVSRLVNLVYTGEPAMLCATAHFHKWKSRKIFNRIFFWHENHCMRCYLYELGTNMRYHEFILHQIKEMKEMPVQGELFLHKCTTCAECNQTVPLQDAIKKDYFNGQTIEEEHFCSDVCHHSWYLSRLNTVGL